MSKFNNKNTMEMIFRTLKTRRNIVNEQIIR